MIYRFLNLFIRLSSLALKFLLLISLAKLLEPSAVATYGLLLASVTFMGGIAGLGFSKYSNREIARSDTAIKSRLIKDQYVFFMLSFLAVAPISSIAFALNLIPTSLMFWFYGIALLEFLSVEHGRTLVALNRQVPATVTLFLRNGAWVVVVLPLLWLNPESVGLDVVFLGWLSGALVACVYGFLVLKKKECSSTGIGSSINWSWMGKGILVALPLLVGTAAVKGLVTFDRIVFFNLHGEDALAIYVIFIGIANIIKVFLDSGVFVFTYPKMIRYASKSDIKNFFLTFREMAIHSILIVTIMIFFCVVSIEILLDWIGRPQYSKNIELFYYCLVSVLFYTINMLFDYPVYSLYLDKVIIFSNVLGLVVFLLSVFLIADYLGYSSVPVAMTLGYIAMGLTKLFALEMFGWRNRVWHRSQNGSE